MTNQQDQNVGNLGDILKHGALVRLANLAAQRAIRGPVIYIDTHSYLMEAPWQNPLKWKQSINTKLAKHPAYTDYVRMEKERLDDDEDYLCSVGLALKIISDRDYHAILSESDEDTRGELESQVRGSNYRADHILRDAAELTEVPTPIDLDDEDEDPSASSMFVLVDPFELDFAEWAQISEGLERFTREETEGIILTFDFDADQDVNDWPDPPKHFKGPIATLDEKPFHLATYATDPMIDRVIKEIQGLGWTVRYDPEEHEDDED